MSEVADTTSEAGAVATPTSGNRLIGAALVATLAAVLLGWIAALGWLAAAVVAGLLGF